MPPVRVSLLVLALLSCSRPTVATVEVPDAHLAPEADAGLGVDAGWALTGERVQAWLVVQRELAKLGSFQSDAGVRDEVRRRARVELAVLADAGLTRSDVDRIEDCIAPFVAERNVERLSGGEALAQFQRALGDLTAEQREKAEAAFASARSNGSPLPGLEAKLGADTVKVLLEHEADLTKTWDALLEARGETK
jgi:hypothetical protein